MNKSLRYFFAIILGWCALTALPSAAMAQTCDITGLASSQSTTLTYDPFSTTGAASTSPVTMTISRLNPGGGERTEQVNMYLTVPNANVPGIQIIPRTVTGSSNVTGSGTGNNIFYNFPTAPTIPSASSTGVGNFLTINYGDNSANGDTATVTFDVILPPNLDLSAIAQLAFRANFSCRFKGQGNSKVWNTGFRNDAIVFPVTVLSALQASYVGSVLDFGEVGDKTTTQVQAAPGTYTRAGDIRVASSGAYIINMTSTNNYRLTFPGGNPVTPGQSLAYNATLVGITRTGISGAPVSPQTAITKTCTKAGVGGILLPISVTLTEGGTTKTPAPAYTDFLNVTVTPQAALVVGSACP
jgi:hypothetical protein